MVASSIGRPAVVMKSRSLMSPKELLIVVVVGADDDVIGRTQEVQCDIICYSTWCLIR